jgi:hypothetical protein
MPTQTNTKEGPIRILAGENLTGKEGFFVKLTHDTGVAEVVLPNDVADDELYLLLEGGADGETVTIEALSPHKQFRAKLKGTCNPGDDLTLGAVDGTDDGKVRTLPATADTYFVFARAEEKGVDGQLVLLRPLLNARAVTVT